MEIHKNRFVEISELRNLFSRWIVLLSNVAKKSKIRRRMHSQDYEALYFALIHSCRAQADQNDGEHRIFFQEMASLIEPWFTLHALESGKQRIMMNLLVQCREIEQILSGRKSNGPSFRRIVQFSLMVLGVCLIALALNYLFNTQDGGSSKLVEMQLAYRRMIYFIKGATFMQKFGVGVVVMVFITIQFIRSSKKY